jgi:DNA-binding beta-propeller fold protein YncE
VPDEEIMAAVPPAAKGVLGVANKGEDTVWLVDLESGRPFAKLPTGPNPQEVVFTPDGRYAAVTNMGHGARAPGRSLTVVDVGGRKVRKEIDLGRHGAPHGLVMLDEKRVLLTSHATDHLVVVNLETGEVERDMPSGGKGTHLVVLSPDKKIAYAANVSTGDVTVVELATGRLVKSIPTGNRAEGISISPDGRQVAIGNVGAHTVSVIDAERLEVVKTLENTQIPIRTFYTSDGKSLLVACAGTGETAVFATDGFQEKKRIRLGDRRDLELVSGPHPMPMNFDRLPGAGLIYNVVLNADAVIAIDEKTLEIVDVIRTGSLPDGIGVTAAKAE